MNRRQCASLIIRYSSWKFEHATLYTSETKSVQAKQVVFWRRKKNVRQLWIILTTGCEWGGNNVYESCSKCLYMYFYTSGKKRIEYKTKYVFACKFLLSLVWLQHSSKQKFPNMYMIYINFYSRCMPLYRKIIFLNCVC